MNLARRACGGFLSKARKGITQYKGLLYPVPRPDARFAGYYGGFVIGEHGDAGLQYASWAIWHPNISSDPGGYISDDHSWRL